MISRSLQYIAALEGGLNPQCKSAKYVFVLEACDSSILLPFCLLLLELGLHYLFPYECVFLWHPHQDKNKLSLENEVKCFNFKGRSYCAMSLTQKKAFYFSPLVWREFRKSVFCRNQFLTWRNRNLSSILGSHCLMYA